MPTSQNGWPVVGHDQVTDRAVHGVEFPNGWLKGDVDTVFTYLIGRLHNEVEPIDDGGCWGWFVKVIEGSSTISNHASGTAIDYNAPAHPMGSRNTYGEADRAKIHRILADLDGVVRWGGDYTGRPDDMHFEINKNAAAVKRVATRIKEDDVALTAEDKKWIAADNDRAARAAAPLVWKVGWSGELAEMRLAKAASAAGAVDALDVQMDAYEAADAGRDAALPLQVRDALAAGQPPEQVAAALRQVAGVDWVAVGRILAQQ